MPIYRLGDLVPKIDPSAWIADNATIIGNVVLGPGVSIWFGAVLRGDNEPITLGARCNVQEGAVLHTDPGYPLNLAEGVSVGHQAMLHGCTIGEGSLVGIQGVVLNGAVIGRHCLVGAGALVTEGKRFDDGSLIVGSPATVKRALTPEQIKELDRISRRYMKRGTHYREALMRIA